MNGRKSTATMQESQLRSLSRKNCREIKASADMILEEKNSSRRCMNGRKSTVVPSMINFENLEAPWTGTVAHSPWTQNVAKLSLKHLFECTKMELFTEVTDWSTGVALCDQPFPTSRSTRSSCRERRKCPFLDTRTKLSLE